MGLSNKYDVSNRNQILLASTTGTFPVPPRGYSRQPKSI